MYLYVQYIFGRAQLCMHDYLASIYFLQMEIYIYSPLLFRKENILYQQDQPRGISAHSKFLGI